tara:strand:+ start:358 stop:525 length:168 start_codon:yes stop_codon:yes gene_type:complete
LIILKNLQKNKQKFYIFLERVKGIEPSSSAWKAAALPLSYTRINIRKQIGGGGWI